MNMLKIYKKYIKCLSPNGERKKVTMELKWKIDSNKQFILSIERIEVDKTVFISSETLKFSGC